MQFVFMAPNTINPPTLDFTMWLVLTAFGLMQPCTRTSKMMAEVKPVSGD